MESKNHFQSYYSKLAKEGMLKALIFGLIFGFIVSIVFAIITFFTNFFNLSKAIGVLIAAGVFVIAAIIATPIIYRLFFRPTTKQIAEKLDGLGYEERFITMLELEKDESYIALRQREDAKSKIGSINRKQIKFNLFSVFKMPLVILAVSGILAISMVATSAVTAKGQIPWSPGETSSNSGSDYDFYTLNYSVEGSGFVYGDLKQLIIPGQNASTVVAVADIGWVFAGWSDGRLLAERTDSKVQANAVIIAIFVVDESSSAEPPPSTTPPSEYEYEEVNQVFDGETYYRDVLQQYYDKAMEMIAEGMDVPPYLQAIMQLYYSMIK